MKNTRVLLRKIQNKPGLFLGEKSLAFLAQFVSGYQFREMIASWEELTGLAFFEHYEEAKSSLMTTSDDFDWFDFNNYVHAYYHLNITTKSATAVISENSTSEEEAFDKFYELLDEYLDEYDKRI